MVELIPNPLSEYEKKTQKSKIIFEEAKKYLPFGVSSNYRYIDPYPIYLEKGKGGKVWDVDGNEYIDFILGFGALEVGHANPKIVEKVGRALENGSILGFEYYKTLELAKIISQRYNVDMVRFSSTGTEATMHAIRIARAYTKRNKVIKFEGHYHGSHDQLLINVNPIIEKDRVPSSPGIPEETLTNTIVAEWNNYDYFEKIVKKYNNDISCVIMEPVAMNMGLIPPEEDFLKGIIELSNEYNFLVIFDEVKTGGKMYSGASGFYKLKPDIMLLAKSIAGGFPLSVIAGKREIMELIGPNKVAHGGTFNANPISVIASITTLKEILTQQAFQYMETLSQLLEKGYRDIADDLDIDLQVIRWGPSGMIYFSKYLPKNYKELLKTDLKSWYSYFYSMLNRGVLPMAGYNEQWTVSVMHSKEDIGKHIEKAYEAIKIAKENKIDLGLYESF
ncbi:aminotransferase class III-fold pyridoxal phosphate-dependent enzyme [Acidianus sulfidivorans JP7]|uniref:Aspartate aminotransferase family protein n=1 Tax=Acidianus sulfidivorans JP7 TaxID=619593 RepID=A0A2U9ILB6_9CREN|nr:aspartate aminotransferase family protein [Acidianus sulfidivorans]AWR96838.1 aminotransferase class III-fold pyridoxal phosphate-dependent enzyme [Acidianus sulfidivorans JP7]